MTNKAGAFEARIDALAVQAEKSVARTDDAIARFEAQFSEAQAARQTEAQAEDRAAAKQIAELVGRLKAEATAAIEAIKAEEAKAGDMVSLFAAAGTANAYGKEAREQADIADNWRLVAVGAACLAVLLSLYFLIASTADGVADQVARAIAVVAIGGLAAYAAKQSARHRHREETARQREVDIVAFGPFVRDWTPDQQATARNQLVTRIFGQDSRAVGGSHPALSDEHINLVSKLAGLFTK